MDKKQIIIISVLILTTALITLNLETIKTSQYAAAFFSQGKSVHEIILKYFNKQGENKVKILIIPGHEPDFGGAEFKGVKERDLNVALAKKIVSNLESNGKFEVILARDYSSWDKNIDSYIKSNLSDIKKWRDSQETDMLNLVANGELRLNNLVTHNTAAAPQALRLYGINKWANENGVDITIHVHFNNNPRINGRPEYKGFSIYIPEKQYSNSTSSFVLANDLMKWLLTIDKVSNMPKETNGVIQDQDLIAIGRYNTADSLVALIEYGYIYDTKISTVNLRKDFIDKMAMVTSKSIENFFENRK